MNVENITKAIAIMERAAAKGSLYMPRWQSPSGGGVFTPASTEEELHTCGNRACFAGHIAVSPEFKADGGSCYYTGAPTYLDEYGRAVEKEAEAVAKWLDIDCATANLFIYPTGFLRNERLVPHIVYGGLWEHVSPRHVIIALKELLSIGEKEFLDKYDLPLLRPGLSPSEDSSVHIDPDSTQGF